MTQLAREARRREKRRGKLGQSPDVRVASRSPAKTRLGRLEHEILVNGEDTQTSRTEVVT